jgi:hypothetical protein
MRVMKLVAVAAMCCAAVWAQTADSYLPAKDSSKAGLLDASKFSINHSVSFGMSSASGSSMKSLGLYSTMLSYRFSQPVTLHMNFGFPLYSSYSPMANPSANSLRSMEYFKNMPMDFTLSWQPRDNLLLQMSVIRAPQDYFYSPYYFPGNRFMGPMFP